MEISVIDICSSTASAEYSCSRMTGKRLSGLTSMNNYQNIGIDAEAILLQFDGETQNALQMARKTLSFYLVI